jgi:hypothetical protein
MTLVFCHAISKAAEIVEIHCWSQQISYSVTYVNCTDCLVMAILMRKSIKIEWIEHMRKYAPVNHYGEIDSKSNNTLTFFLKENVNRMSRNELGLILGRMITWPLFNSILHVKIRIICDVHTLK